MSIVILPQFLSLHTGCGSVVSIKPQGIAGPA